MVLIHKKKKLATLAYRPRQSQKHGLFPSASLFQFSSSTPVSTNTLLLFEEGLKELMVGHCIKFWKLKAWWKQ